ncbi:MAG TPA: ribosomal protein L7/L12 [Labilithrix sp.]
MTLTALRCPECTAPASAGTTKCAYCGATFIAERPRAARMESRYSLVVRVAPSNVERVANLLRDHLRVDVKVAAGAPFEIEVGADEAQANAIAHALSEAGAQAEITTRSVAIPLLTVTLEDAGKNKNAMIVAIRAELELGIVETKKLLAALPHVLVRDVEEEKARAFASALEAAGGRVSVSGG